MKKTHKEIIKQIRALLDELEGVAPGKSSSASTTHKETAASGKKPLSGCIGAIQMLVEEGFMDELKTVQQVMDKLKEEGNPYSRALVSMNLLNLVKRRVLRRVEEKDQWNYIIRK